MSAPGQLDRLMMGVMYAPFCRTLPPPAEDWDRDLGRIRELGFSCLHAFVEWHSIEREPGRFDFSLPDRIVELAARHGLVPLLNIATLDGVGYYSPRWLMAEYRGEGVVSNEGAENIPRGLYVIPCLDDPWYQAYAERYLAAVASHYRDNPVVGGWIIWGEPGRIGRSGRLTCYCMHTVRRFQEWLKARYARIEGLNRVWATEGPADFSSWGEVSPPTGAARHMGGYGAFADWRAFMDDNMAGHVANVDSVLKRNGVRQPTIVEIMGWQGNQTTASIDPWKLAESADVVGVSNFLPPGQDTAFVLSRADSIARQTGKEFLVVEALGGPRYHTRPARTPSDDELALEAAQAVGSGAMGLMYWCYRPRLSDVEGGEFGLVRADGSPLPRAARTGGLSASLSRAQGMFTAAHRAAEIAIFDSQSIQHVSFADDLRTDVLEYNASLRGAFGMVADAHLEADFISPRWIERGGLSRYKVLLLPYSYVIDASTAESIRAFVSGGGTVIADYPLGLKDTAGVCYRTLPGGCLQEVFGFARSDVRYLEDREGTDVGGVTLPDHTFVEIVEPAAGATILARFRDGTPATVSNRHGAGWAVYHAFQLFALYGKRPNRRWRSGVVSWLERAGVERVVRVLGAEEEDSVDIGVATLAGPEGSRVITFMNHGTRVRELSVDIAGHVNGIVDVLAEHPAPFERHSDGARIRMTLPPSGYRVVATRVS